MLLKICNKCGNVIQYPNRYCTSCEAKAEEIRKENKLKADKKYNNKRDPKYIRFYNSTPWKILDYTNLQCLCIECHNKIHRRFQHKKRRR